MTLSMEPRKLLSRSITEEKLRKALEEVQADKDLAMDGCKIILIDENHYEAVLSFLGEHFAPDEPISREIGISRNPEMDRIWMTQIKHNLSLAIVSEDTGEIISGIINMVVDRNFSFQTAEEKSTRLYNVVELLKKRCDIFQRYNVDEAIYIGELCTRADFRRKGFATRVLKAAISFLSKLEFNNAVIFAEGTSKFSQRVFEKDGLDTLTEVKYSEYKENGKAVFSNMEQHDSMILYARIL